MTGGIGLYRWRRTVLLFGAYLLISLALYSPSLTAFFIFDDLSVIRMGCFDQSGFLAAFMPTENGFIRPLQLLTIEALIAVFGFEPMWTHLFAVLLHAINCTLTAVLSGLLFPERRFLPAVSGLLMAVNIAGFQCVTQVANVCDAYFAAGTLAFCIAWLWNPSPQRKALRQLLLLCSFLLAILGKETGIIIGPAAFVLLLLARKPGSSIRRDDVITASFYVVASCSYFVLAWLSLKHHQSYVNEGRITVNIAQFLRQFTDYALSPLLPYLHILAAPNPLPLNHSILWIIRIIAFLAMLAAAAFAWRRLPGTYCALALLAALPVLPACAISGPPVSRYLYASLPFSGILVGLALTSADRGIRIASRVLFAPLYLWMIVGFFASPTLKNYATTAKRVEQLVDEMKRLQHEWPSGSTITILDHPHSGAEPWRWVYVQHLAYIFLHEKRLTVALTPDSNSVRTYRFQDGKLVEP